MIIGDCPGDIAGTEGHLLADHNRSASGGDDLRIVKEQISELHRFFVKWYTGIELGDDGFEAFERSLGAGFCLISPDGQTLKRGDVISFVRANRGNEDGEFDIEITDVSVRVRGIDLVAAAYTEIQSRNDEKTTRLSSAVFRPAPGKSSGFIWEHLLQTWAVCKKAEQGAAKGRDIK